MEPPEQLGIQTDGFIERSAAALPVTQTPHTGRVVVFLLFHSAVQTGLIDFTVILHVGTRSANLKIYKKQNNFQHKKCANFTTDDDVTDSEEQGAVFFTFSSTACY